MNRSVIAVAAGIFAATSQYAADVRHLTLTEAVHLAISQNRALKIARLKVAESQQKKAGERSGYFPSLKNESNLLHITELENVIIPAGSFGIAAGSPVPAQSATLPQGKTTLYSSGTQLSQPLTQLIRVRDANRMAAADIAISHDDLKRAENEIALQVHSVYYGILIAKLQKQAAEQQTLYADESLRESENDVRNGNALQVAAIQSRATVL
jgi:outer membrane protein TolC